VSGLCLKGSAVMDMDKERLREHYRRVSDADIERLANYEAAGLRPEALDILREEIKRRGLSGEFNKAVDIQLKGVSEEEQQELIRRIALFPCPVCGGRQNYLNAFHIMNVRSYIIITAVSKSMVIACPECISKSDKRALLRNLLLGWWGIPWGPIRTIHSVFFNLDAINSKNENTPTREFAEFIKPHSAAIKVRIEKIDSINELFDVIQSV
jgi:hypothetical protein